jgi:hypothetical protein
MLETEGGECIRGRNSERGRGEDEDTKSRLKSPYCLIVINNAKIIKHAARKVPSRCIIYHTILRVAISPCDSILGISPSNSSHRPQSVPLAKCSNRGRSHRSRISLVMGNHFVIVL